MRSALAHSFNLMLLAILALFLVACLFAHPIADDFIYASHGRFGFWNAWSREYAGWNGRYASNAFLLGTPLTFGWLAGYRVAAAVMIVSTPAAVYLFVRALAAGGLTRREALACSLTFSALYLSQVPSLGEGIYWYTAAATYHAPLILALLHVTLVLRYVRHDPHTIGDRLSLPLAIVLLVAIAGFNEVVMLIMLVLYGVMLTWSLREGGGKEGPHRILWGGLFAFTAVCALVVLLSPGNRVRQSMFPTHHDLARSLGMTALQTVRFSADWICSGSLLLATALFVPIAEKLSRHHRQDPRRARQYLWLAVAGLFFVIPAAVFPAFWETGTLGQHRTVNTAYFAFLILWFIAISMFLASGGNYASALRSFGHQWRVPLGVLLLAALALTRNSYALGLDLISGRFATFDREMDGRYAALRACQERGERTCDIDAIRIRPASFYVFDVSADPSHWVNVSYARYFGVPEVRLRNGSAQ